MSMGSPWRTPEPALRYAAWGDMLYAADAVMTALSRKGSLCLTPARVRCSLPAVDGAYMIGERIADFMREGR